jgi:hypothetical protein
MAIFLSKKEKEIAYEKIFAMIMTICLMASAPCVTTLAAESTDDFVITVSAEKEDDTVVKLEDYPSFEADWNFAMKKAKDNNYLDNNDYGCIVVDLYADWKANADGEFGDGEYLLTKFTLRDCNLGNSTYEKVEKIVFVDTDAENAPLLSSERAHLR